MKQLAERGSKSDCIAIIPARGGSKGIPHKNLRTVASVPLIARAIRAARNAGRVGQVYVSTDDPHIAEISIREQAMVIDRPVEISGDTASSEAALLHGLDVLASQGNEPKLLVFLQCTSPFILPSEIDQCVAALDDPTYAASFAATSSHKFYWTVASDGRAVGINHDETQPRERRQELSPEYAETGSIYVMRVADFRKMQHRFCGPTAVVPINTLPVEIDSLDDLKLCEIIAANRGEGRHNDAALFAKARAIVLDFDGVLTDDRVIVFDDGHEAVVASRADGLGLEALRRKGFPILILSKETNPVVSERAKKLQVPVLQAVEDKLTAITSWVLANNLTLQDIVYMGNDINDLACLSHVGFPVAPADARPEVLQIAKHVTLKPGGHGAVREICDLLLASH